MLVNHINSTDVVGKCNGKTCLFDNIRRFLILNLNLMGKISIIHRRNRMQAGELIYTFKTVYTAKFG